MQGRTVARYGVRPMRAAIGGTSRRSGSSTPPYAPDGPVSIFARVDRAGQTNGSVAFAAPADMRVGDMMIAMLSFGGNGATVQSSGPVGWEKLTQTDFGNACGAVFWKRAAASDLGSTFTFTGQADSGGSMYVIRNARAGADWLTDWSATGLSANQTSGALLARSSTVLNSLQLSSWHLGWGVDYALTKPAAMTAGYETASGTASAVGINFGSATRTGLPASGSYGGTWAMSTAAHWVGINMIIAGSGVA
jgi:hypothetical protein